MAVEITYIDGWDEWLFGLTFLENYYTVYDMDQQRIGFAMSKSSNMAPGKQQVTSALLATGPSEVVSESISMSTNASYAAYAAVPVLALGLLYKAFKSRK